MKKSFYLFFIFSLVFMGGCNAYPPDDLLERRFQENKADFEKLIKMFQEDSNLFQISLDKGALESFYKKAQISEERLLEYKKILSKLGIEYIERYEKRQDIFLRVWSSPSLFIGGKSKFYVYDEKEVKNTVDSLDEIYRSGQEANEMKKIKGNWYLYLDVW